MKIATLLAAALLAAPALAGFSQSMRVTEPFWSLQKVAVVTTACSDNVNCEDVERAVAAQFAGSKLKLKSAAQPLVHKALFDMGLTAYDPERRAELATALGVDAFVELKVPFGARPDGFGGRQGAEVKLELTVVGADGTLIGHGSGTGRPMNVVQSAETVAGTIARKMIEHLERIRPKK
jgi:hypothetical protein